MTKAKTTAKPATKTAALAKTPANFTANVDPSTLHLEQVDAAIDAVATQLAATQEEMMTVVGHPLFAVFCAAIHQAAYGKGGRHGGARTAFFDQPWAHYARMHGRGFLTGQAAKKLEEAGHGRYGEYFETEMLGAIVYAGMSVLAERGDVRGVGTAAA